MTHAEFTKQIDVLKATYGQNAYPDPRVLRIWSWAKRINATLFKMTVENAIGDCDRPPLLSKLKEFYGEVRNKNAALEKIKCDFCDGGGWICDDQPLPTAYACRCEAGNGIPEVYARWRGPWKRIVPHPNELIRTGSANVIHEAFATPHKASDATETHNRMNMLEAQAREMRTKEYDE